MLKNIDPALNADVLRALRAMGHGDVLAVTDSNFPSESISSHTISNKPLNIGNVSSTRAIEAILSVFPLDTPLGSSFGRMEVIGLPDEIPPVQQEAQGVLDRFDPDHGPMHAIERWDFYEKAKEAFCIISTGETRLYGCFLLTKGVIRPG